ncbi:hypothetical protein [Nonomuraea sp. NPDC049646]|uniref:hypothetical protein n=1 Tax=unclassified Nonomuraea TaxID=2593643 RepID=UPI0037ACD5B3
MTADQFTTPAAPAEQAKVLLSYAADDSHFFDSFGTHLPLLRGEKHTSTAMYAAQAATAHAMLAVRDELADIAASLRTLAAMPSAINTLAAHMNALDDTVGGGLAEIADAVHKHSLGASDDQCAIVEAINTHGETVDSAISDVIDAMDRPRWWQWRRRWTLRRLAKTMALTQVSEVCEFRLELLRPIEADETSECEPLACTTFNTTYGNAADIARLLLPSLCDEAGVPADPEQVYGRVAGRDIGGEFLFHTVVCLPGADVIDAPEGF